MKTHALPVVISVVLLLTVPGPALAHSFGQLYNLPVPVWMYLYGAAAALAGSFLVVAWFVGARSVGLNLRRREIGGAGGALALRGALLPALKLLSVGALLLCMATGFFGTKNAYANFNMTFFWIVFVLGLAYLTAFVGDAYALINPWKVLAEGLESFAAHWARGRIAYPQRLGYYPALAFYMAFIWIELFAGTTPPSLAALLLAYSAMNFAGIWLVGKAAWFRYCEFFAVFFRLLAKMAPLEYVPPAAPGQRGVLRLRAPFVGVLQEHADHVSLLLFVLFMLSSTAFDGVRETVPWKQIFWTDLYQVLKPWLAADPGQTYSTLRKIHLGTQTLALVLSPFLYLAMYLACIALAKAVTRSPLPLRELALRFAFALLPIALVYNITHYWTLILTQGLQIVRLVSDPFGFGWNLFGTAGWLATPMIPNPSVVWHTQVWLILFGHIVSVYLAHIEALRVFPTRRQATLSQLPMLLLMMAFTTIGLWILAQPLDGGAGG
ncbi:MAG TPA: hypothetical protein VM240_07540 [Verrucomicrobiae bacterium]|nr:hypothetical protein [Verrucomicrobiae bacterium]